jgi:hypothetical protein
VRIAYRLVASLGIWIFGFGWRGVMPWRADAKSPDTPRKRTTLRLLAR